MMPLGSGIVVEVVDVDAELAANCTMNDAKAPDPDAGVNEEVLVFVLGVALAAGFNVSPMPVCTVTSAPGVTSAGSYPMMAGPSI